MPCMVDDAVQVVLASLRDEARLMITNAVANIAWHVAYKPAGVPWSSDGVSDSDSESPEQGDMEHNRECAPLVKHIER